MSTRPCRSARLAPGHRSHSSAPASPPRPPPRGIWTEIPSGTTQNITAIEYQSASRFWFTTAAGAIFKRQPTAASSSRRARRRRAAERHRVPGRRADRARGRQRRAGAALDRRRRRLDRSPVGLPQTRSDCKRRGADRRHQRRALRRRPARRGCSARASQIVRSQPGDPTLVGSEWRRREPRPTPARSAPDDDLQATRARDRRVLRRATPTSATSSRATLGGVLHLQQPRLGGREKAGAAGNAGTPARVIAGDPENPNRMWSVNAQPYGRSTTAYTRDGWQTSASGSRSATTRAREFPETGPADVDYAGGTVLAAGDAGLVLQLDRRRRRSSTTTPTARSRRSAGTRSGSRARAKAPIGGDNGKLAMTSAPTSSRRPRRPRRPVADARRQRRSPTVTPTAGGHAPAADLHAHRRRQRRTAKIGGGKVKIVVKRQDQGPERRPRQEAAPARSTDDQEGQDAAHRPQREARARSAPSPRRSRCRQARSAARRSW